MTKLNTNTPRLIINRSKVGVKSPVTGTGIAVAVAVGAGEVDGLGLPVAIGVGVDPDSEAVKAGTSPAETTKSRVKNRVIPLISTHETVIV